MSAPATARLDFDTLYGEIARRSMRKAELLRANPHIYEVIEKVVAGVERFCTVHQVGPADVRATGFLSPEGKVVISLRRA